MADKVNDSTKQNNRKLAFYLTNYVYATGAAGPVEVAATHVWLCVRLCGQLQPQPQQQLLKSNQLKCHEQSANQT